MIRIISVIVFFLKKIYKYIRNKYLKYKNRTKKIKKNLKLFFISGISYLIVK